MSDEIGFLTELLKKRLRWVEANRENNFEAGIQRLLTDLYPDTAHFIFELLQNAEDAEASRIVFDLKKEKLIVTHDGKRLFNNKDVDSITSIGVSTKKDDVNQIGKFGIGFKAVFAYTASPRIYSGSFSFEIRDLVCPHPLEAKPEKRKETLFEFPFNHLKKHKAEAFKETARGLENLRENVLLFLNNIETIEWNIEGKGKGFIKRLSHSNKHFEVEHKNITGKTVKSHWLRFTKQIDPNSKIKNVAVAFKLGFHEGIKGKKKNLFDNKVSISKQLQIIPIDGQLSVFFPAEKETTKLKFHIHGPFASIIARDSIPHSNNDNKRLIQNIGLLLSESLHKIKEMGLLTVGFLAVLPNDGDDLADFYKPLQAAVIKEMKANPLVPTLMKGHAPATQLNQGPAAIREVIANADLQFLLKKKSIIQWAAGAMQNSRQERFMRLLGINEWSLENLVDAIKDKFSGGNDRDKQWLAAKNDDWMQKLYILLKKAMDETHSSMSYCHIARLQSGEHVSGANAFFPSEENKKSKKSDIFPRVKSDLLHGKRKQGVRQFLEAIGVKEVGKEEEIEHILKTYYSPYEDYEDNEVSHKQHIAHMKKFVSHWTTQKEDAKDMFSKYEIFYDFSGVTLRSPKELYLDMPYLGTGLSEYFQHTKNSKRKKYKLWSGYKKEKLKDFETFVQAIGIMTKLEIVEHTATALQSNIFPGRKGRVNKDFFINGLEYAHDDSNSSVWSSKHSPCYIGTLDLSRKNIYLSMLIWRCMCNASPNVLSAIYKTNYTEKNDSSYLVKQLKEASWIPDKNRKFRKPAEMTRSMLHKDFPYDDRNGWLTAIGFGENERKETEEYKNLKAVFKKIGLSRKVIEMIPDLAKLPEEQQIKIVRDVIQQSKAKTCFPSKEAPNPERRALKIAEKLAEAPPKTYSIKDRSVRTSNSEVRPEVKTYLRNLYTNDDNEMICQICEKEMPFKLADGSYYFEAVECVENFPKECKENYIALCPVCAAKFKHVNKSKPKDIRSLIIKANELTIPITLARESKTIRFVKMHLEDLKAIFKSKSGM